MWGTLETAPAVAVTRHQAPTPAHDKPVLVTAVASHYHQPMLAYRPPHVSWPSGTAKVTLSGAGRKRSRHPVPRYAPDRSWCG